MTKPRLYYCYPLQHIAGLDKMITELQLDDDSAI